MNLSLEHYWAEDMPKDAQKWALALCKSNMEEMYNRAKYNGGWNSEIKLEELAAPEARFLVAYQKVLSLSLTRIASNPNALTCAECMRLYWSQLTLNMNKGFTLNMSKGLFSKILQLAVALTLACCIAGE